MRVIFMGSPEFSVPVLNALVEADHEVICVYCQPPRPAGRGKKERPTSVQARAEELGLPVRYPKSMKSAEAQAEFADLKADVAVVVAYGLLLPQAILDATEQGCLNIHASLLPRWRGAAPIHRAIMAGDQETGVCIMQMDEGLDTGPVLMQETCAILPSDTTGVLHDRLSQLGAKLILDALHQFPHLTPTPQANDGVTYAHKIDKSEAQIDWTRSAPEIERQIRGLSPFPGAWTLYQGERVKFLGGKLASGEGEPGTVLDGLIIACGEGAVEITRAQRAGKAAMDAQDILRGWDLTPGTRLGE